MPSSHSVVSRTTLAAAAVILTTGLPALAAQDDFRWNGTLQAGQQLEIKNLNGAIFAEASSGDRVEIVAEKSGRDADEVSIEVVEHDGGITVCSVYPGSGRRPSVCAPGDDAHLSNDDDLKANIEFRVRVPAGVRVDASTMNGRIEATGMTTALRAVTMNGAIEVSTTGWAELTTMNGSIEARMGSTAWQGQLDIETMNGSIELVLPTDAAADVEARTMNGTVSSDWSLSYPDSRRRNRAEGRLGAGGRELSLETMNGSITIRRSR